MAEPHNFYLAPEDWAEPFTLRGPEAHHLGRVLRIKAGEQVRLLDGLGRAGLFTVAEVGKKEVRLTLEREEISPAPRVRCTLAAGFSKALRRGWFLEKSVELEAHRLWFWQGDYSQASLPDMEKSGWRADLLAGAKQCGNPRLPELALVKGGVAELAERARHFDRAFMLYEGDTQGRMLEKSDLAVPGDILLVVGPEGGFSPREVEMLQTAGVAPVSLGNRILRWETAAVLTLGLAWWAGQFEGLRPLSPSAGG